MNGPGRFPVSLLSRWAEGSAARPSFTGCLVPAYAPLAVPLSEKIIRSGINSTPTVKLNGTAISNATLVQPGNALEKLIEAAGTPG